MSILTFIKVSKIPSMVMVGIFFLFEDIPWRNYYFQAFLKISNLKINHSILHHIITLSENMSLGLLLVLEPQVQNMTFVNTHRYKMSPQSTERVN